MKSRFISILALILILVVGPILLLWGVEFLDSFVLPVTIAHVVYFEIFILLILIGTALITPLLSNTVRINKS